MTRYHACFSVFGEVIDMRLIDSPTPRLLIDISAKPENEHVAPGFVYRTSFSVLDRPLIDDLQSKVAPGDVVEAAGTFWQTGYVPHPNGRIDTTFRLTGWKLVEKRDVDTRCYDPFSDIIPAPIVH